MSVITQNYDIDLKATGEFPVVKMSQFDTGSRTIVFTVYDGHELAGIDGMVARVDGTRSDGVEFTSTCTVSAGSKVSFTISQEMTKHAGKHAAELVIFDAAGNPIGTQNFLIEVEAASMSRDSAASADDRTLYDQFTGSVSKTVADKMTSVDSKLAGVDDKMAGIDTQISTIVDTEIDKRIKPDPFRGAWSDYSVDGTVKFAGDGVEHVIPLKIKSQSNGADAVYGSATENAIYIYKPGVYQMTVDGFYTGNAEVTSRVTVVKLFSNSDTDGVKRKWSFTGAQGIGDTGGRSQIFRGAITFYVPNDSLPYRICMYTNGSNVASLTSGSLSQVVVTRISSGGDILEQGVNTLKVGKTTTGAPGTQESVTNSGTAKDVVLDFTIPTANANAIDIRLIGCKAGDAAFDNSTIINDFLTSNPGAALYVPSGEWYIAHTLILDESEIYCDGFICAGDGAAFTDKTMVKCGHQTFNAHADYINMIFGKSIKINVDGKNQDVKGVTVEGFATSLFYVTALKCKDTGFETLTRNIECRFHIMFSGESDYNYVSCGVRFSGTNNDNVAHVVGSYATLGIDQQASFMFYQFIHIWGCDTLMKLLPGKKVVITTFYPDHAKTVFKCDNSSGTDQFAEVDITDMFGIYNTGHMMLGTEDNRVRIRIKNPYFAKWGDSAEKSDQALVLGDAQFSQVFFDAINIDFRNTVVVSEDDLANFTSVDQFTAKYGQSIVRTHMLKNVSVLFPKYSGFTDWAAFVKTQFYRNIVALGYGIYANGGQYQFGASNIVVKCVPTIKTDYLPSTGMPYDRMWVLFVDTLPFAIIQGRGNLSFIRVYDHVGDTATEAVQPDATVDNAAINASNSYETVLSRIDSLTSRVAALEAK